MSVVSLTAEQEYDRAIRSVDRRRTNGEDRTWLIRRADGARCSWPEIRAEVLSRGSYTCVDCGSVATEVDHIWPRRWGGRDHLENLQALCGTCNRRKGASLDWMGAANHQLGAVMGAIAERLNADVFGVGVIAHTHLGARVHEGSMDRDDALDAVTGLVMHLQHALDQAQTWRHELERTGHERWVAS